MRPILHMEWETLGLVDWQYYRQLIRKTGVWSQRQTTDAVSLDEHQLCTIISHIHEVCCLSGRYHQITALSQQGSLHYTRTGEVMSSQHLIIIHMVMLQHRFDSSSTHIEL